MNDLVKKTHLVILNFTSDNLGFYVLIACFLFIMSCKQNELKIDKDDGELKLDEEIFCGAEDINETGFLSSDKNFIFRGLKYRSNENSYAGNYSIKLTEKNQWGFSIVIKNIKANDSFEVSVWRHSINNSGLLSASAATPNTFFFKQKDPIITNKDGWQLLKLNFTIPPHITNEDLKIYVWDPFSGKESPPIFFDDIKIRRISEKSYPYYTNALHITIDSIAMQKLEAKRKNAYIKGILESSEDDWVQGTLLYNNDTLKAQFRLKGDWLDHLNGKKWSFRIKIKNGSWKRMKSFSIQNPRSRDFLSEWGFHKLLLHQGVLTTRYGFIPITINGKSLGIYAYEEHFDKQLIEYNYKREGPILKFSEEAFWIQQKLNIEKEIKEGYEVFEASNIIPFKKNRTASNISLLKQFSVAQNLMYQYKNRMRPISDILDVEYAAKFYALSNFGKAYHGFTWHNQRFYYNPILCLLEPIAYDCYTSEGVYDWLNHNAIFGNFETSKTENINNETMLLYQLFTDTTFVKKYIYYLEKYCETGYIDKIFNALLYEAKIYEEQIKKEYPNYKFDSFLSYKNQLKEISNKLKSYKNKITKGLYKNIKNTALDKNPNKLRLNENFGEHLVDAYIESRNEHGCRVRVQNNSNREILLIGIRMKKDSINYSFSVKHKLPGLKNGSNKKNFIEIDVNARAEAVIFKIAGNEKQIITPIFQWNTPKNYNPRQDLTAHGLSSSNISSSPMVTIKNDSIIFNEGEYNLETHIVIPENRKVIIMPGVNLNINKGAAFISYSPVFFMGNKNKKIVIHSDDGTAMGITVLRAREKSIINHTYFEQLNTLKYNNWELTGAINFYESDILMSNSTIKNNRCEDALNVIRANFEIKNCIFDNIFLDGFDSDFSTGKIFQTEFRGISNDAIDFSATIAEVNNCNITDVGDKGVSVGEESKIDINNLNINRCNVGIASKDLSIIKVNNSIIKKSNYGIVIFEKKEEYGSAKVIANSAKFESVIQPYLIEKGSEFILNNKTILGNKKNISKLFK